jgi:hypothetical protein
MRCGDADACGRAYRPEREAPTRVRLERGAAFPMQPATAIVFEEDAAMIRARREHRKPEARVHADGIPSNGRDSRALFRRERTEGMQIGAASSVAVTLEARAVTNEENARPRFDHDALRDPRRGTPAKPETCRPARAQRRCSFART